MSDIFISVVSHCHLTLIKELDCLPALSQKYQVVVKANDSDEVHGLRDYCTVHGISLIVQDLNQGFGKNNNDVFDHCTTALGMKGEDTFICLNPDVFITPTEIDGLVERMNQDSTKVAAINLYKDSEYIEYDNSIRYFPTLKDFIYSFLLSKNMTCIDKGNIHIPTKVDWAAGSFLAFKASHYFDINGFDSRYFMYCEDIDICYRSLKVGIPVVFYPMIKARHLAKHGNRRFLSKHFYWHVTSVIRFLIYKTLNPIKIKRR